MKMKPFISWSRMIIILTAAFFFAACPTSVDEEPDGESSGVSYTVTFTAGEGSGEPPPPQTVPQGTSITLPAQGSMIAPPNKEFEGWKTGEQTYEAEASFTVNGDAEFTAQWIENIDPNKTYIQFRNLERFPVTLYSDASRQVEIARVPAAGTTRVEADPKPQGTVFYPRFLLDLDGISLNYDGTAVMVRVDEKKVNDVNIPALTTVETDSAFIKIENESIYSLTFNQGPYELLPVGKTSHIVMPEETGGYQIQPGAAGLYTVMKNGSVPLAFPEQVVQFEAEILYTFIYDGSALTLSSAKTVIDALSGLSAPDSVSAIVESSSAISLTWAEVEGASSYRVYRSTSSDGDFTAAGTVSGLTYTDENLSAGITYYYKIQGLILDRKGYLSEALAVRILPAAPQQPRVNGKTMTTISLVWDAVEGASSYRVYRSASRGTGFAVAGTVSGLTYTDENLEERTTYYYKIQGVDRDTAGASPLSEQLAVATDSSVSIGTITYSSVSGGAWTLQSDGSYRSPSIAHGALTKARISFICKVPSPITIQLRVSSESNYDWAFISALDNASATASSGHYNGSRISGTTSVTVSIPVQTTGSHFIDIGYQKDGLGSSGSDCAWFTVIH